MSDRWGTGRIEAFSDGVFAIAITLLVLEISVPESDFEDLWKGIADQWPSYLGYATSFLTIGALWFIHHGIFRRLASADAMVMRLNILLLMLVSFLPFPDQARRRGDRPDERRARGRHLLRACAAFDLGRDQRALALRGRPPSTCSNPTSPTKMSRQ